MMKNAYPGNNNSNFEDANGYDESFNTINNAAAAYALYGRMFQQQQVCLIK